MFWFGHDLPWVWSTRSAHFLGHPLVTNIQLRHSLHFLSGSRCINLFLPILLHTLHCQSHSFWSHCHSPCTGIRHALVCIFLLSFILHSSYLLGFPFLLWLPTVWVDFTFTFTFCRSFLLLYHVAFERCTWFDLIWLLELFDPIHSLVSRWFVDWLIEYIMHKLETRRST